MNWISVKDRLPEKFTNVLVAQRYRERYYIFVGCKFDEVWTDTEDVVSHITHWMPLPEPPEGIK